MMKFLRSQSQTVLIAVLAVIGFGFFFYGNSGNMLSGSGGRAHNGDYGRIDGEDISMAELVEAIRNERDAMIISGQNEALSQPGASGEMAERAWSQLLLLHEAKRLHVEVTDKQVADAIRNMPVFQKDGVYSPAEYQTLMTNLQNNVHITPDTFETIVRNNLRIEAMHDALFSTVRASAQDVETQYQKYYGPSQAGFVSFDRKSFVDSASVTPEEIQTEYKDHPANPAYRTKEKRQVDYVLLELTPEQAKLPHDDKARTAAIEALGEKALDFVVKLQPDPSATTNNAPPSDFIEGAKKLGLTPKTTDFFTDDTTPAGVPPSPTFNSTAFSLTKDNPISKVAEVGNGVAVLHLVEIQPSVLRPLEEVKSEITKTLQQNKGALAQNDAAKNAAEALKTAVAKGTDFKTAAAALHLKVETTPSFVPYLVSEKDTRLRAIAYVATTLPVGGVSDPMPSDTSILVVHLDSRATADSANLAQFETQYRQQQEQRLGSYVFYDWTNWYGKRPGTRKPADLDQYGSVE